jgi:hypothetical protein
MLEKPAKSQSFYQNARRKCMNTKKLLPFVVVLTLAATGFGQVRQNTHVSDTVSINATTACQFTFTSGGGGPNFLKFCVTVNGNVVQLMSPGGFEHIREGTILEGYSICDFGSLTRYYDFAAADSGNWQAPVISGVTLPLTIKRSTSDGIYTLTQVFNRNTVEPAVTITMTLKNNTVASHNFALVRYADIDANNANGGTFNNWFDFDHQSAWGYNNGFNLFGLMLYSVPTKTGHFGFVQDTADFPDSCNPVAHLPSSTPWFGDGSAGLDWNGTLGASAAVTVTGEYRRF